MTRTEAADMIKNDIHLHRDYLSGEYRKALKMAISALEQPEIIRCKDCKHRPEKDSFIALTEDTMKCPCDGGDYIHSWIPEDNFYCANAERREDS